MTSDATYHYDPSINNAGDVVWSQDGNVYGLIGGQMQQLTTSGNAWAMSISNSGEVVWSENTVNGARLYSSTRGQLTCDGCPGGNDHMMPTGNACGDVSFNVTSSTMQVFRLGNNAPCYTPPAVTSGSLTAGPASPQVVNTPIMVTATATGGSVNKEYQFAVKDPVTNVMTVIQEYGPANTFPYTPTTAGTYSIRVFVRNVGSILSYEAAYWLSTSVTP
jgi:hypothetical protein